MHRQRLKCKAQTECIITTKESPMTTIHCLSFIVALFQLLASPQTPVQTNDSENPIMRPVQTSSLSPNTAPHHVHLTANNAFPPEAPLNAMHAVRQRQTTKFQELSSDKADATEIVVDRIDESYAVLEANNEIFMVPKSILPNSAQFEGAVLQWHAASDLYIERRNEAAKRIERLQIASAASIESL